MGRKAQLSENQHSQIVALSLHTSKTLREIDADIGVSDSSVTKIIKLHELTGGTDVRQRSSRPVATSDHTDRMIRREAVRDPFITARGIKENLAPLLNNVTERTIRARLQKKFHIIARKPLK
jgi:transposase